MKIWKVILATLAIFAAGAFTGGLVMKNRLPKPVVIKPQADPLLYPIHVQEFFLKRMDRELDLTPEQHARIEKVFAESRERIKIMYDIIGPELRAELQHVHDKVRAELHPEQRDEFEQLLKKRPRKSNSGDDKDRKRSASSAATTNAP